MAYARFPAIPRKSRASTSEIFRGAFGAAILCISDDILSDFAENHGFDHPKTLFRARNSQFYLVLVMFPQDFRVLSSACLWGHFTLICLKPISPFWELKISFGTFQKIRRNLVTKKFSSPAAHFPNPVHCARAPTPP